jgi:hypothetical protein
LLTALHEKVVLSLLACGTTQTLLLSHVGCHTVPLKLDAVWLHRGPHNRAALLLAVLMLLCLKPQST